MAKNDDMVKLYVDTGIFVDVIFSLFMLLKLCYGHQIIKTSKLLQIFIWDLSDGHQANIRKGLEFLGYGCLRSSV